MTNEYTRIAQAALCAAVIHVTLTGRIPFRKNRNSHIEDCHEQIQILVEALQRAEQQSNYLIEIINKHEVGTPFDNIVINSLM